MIWAILVISMPVVVLFARLLYLVLLYLSQRSKYDHLQQAESMDWVFKVMFGGDSAQGDLFHESRDQDGRAYPLLNCGPNLDGHQFLIAQDPEIVREVLVNAKDFPRYPASYWPLQGVIGDGIYTKEGKEFHTRRKAMQPLFHRENLLSILKNTANTSYEFISNLEDGKLYHATPIFREMQIYNAINLVFGQNPKQLDKKLVAETYIKMLLAPSNYLTGQQILGKINHYLPFPWSRSVKTRSDALYNLFDDLINQRRKELSEIDEPYENQNYEDLLTSLLLFQRDDGTNFTNSDIINEMRTFCLAGHSSAAKTLGWATYHIGRNIDIQRKLQEEVDRILKGRPIQEDDISLLVYTKQVVKEALRIRPVVYLDRLVTKDTQIGDHYIPAGACLSLYLQGLHMDSRYWEDPDTFDPERFSVGKEQSRVPFSYIPFAGGPRGCIGKKFGMQESIVGLATLVQHFEVDSSSSPDIVPMDINSSCTNITFKLRKRF
eukprot:TRINITY_DN1181_c0_g1_i2.p1 TRINITY_DN1181_c0_g1~~TRINITY_DN1181_c0_g1_i2.p1  ORF type:complete len:491 (-),score=80.01 TRINITY_DN1181_c0_g1_i2:2153-3625(-)